MPNFPLPPSYGAYCKDRAVRSAVDHILDAKKLEVPADLGWGRLPDFHAAVLAAHQVRCDFATALHGLWKAVWPPALDDCGFADSLEPLSLHKQQELLDYPCDTYSLWVPGFLERVYDRGDHRIGLGVFVDNEQAWLAVWHVDEHGKDQTAEMSLGDDWAPELDGDEYRYSHDELARFSNDGCCIPLDPLNRAARRALQEIGRILGLPEQR